MLFSGMLWVNLLPFTFSERDCVPRFAEPGTIEYEVASRWAAFYDHEKTLKDEVEVRLKEEKANVEKEIQQLLEQHHTLMIRQGKTTVGWVWWGMGGGDREEA